MPPTAQAGFTRFHQPNVQDECLGQTIFFQADVQGVLVLDWMKIWMDAEWNAGNFIFRNMENANSIAPRVVRDGDQCIRMTCAKADHPGKE